MMIICDKGSMNIYLSLFPLLSVFVLTSSKIVDYKHGTKLVVVNGLGNDIFPESEVIDLESDTGGDCNHWTNFPNYVVFGGTGALFDIESANETQGTFLLIDMAYPNC